MKLNFFKSIILIMALMPFFANAGIGDRIREFFNGAKENTTEHVKVKIIDTFNEYCFKIPFTKNTFICPPINLDKVLDKF